jgi:hypothetical protein
MDSELGFIKGDEEGSRRGTNNHPRHYYINDGHEEDSR